MDTNTSKPLFKDLKKQKWHDLLKGESVSSEGKVYEFADRPLLVIVFIEIFAAFLFILLYIPDVKSFEQDVIRLILFIAIWVYPALYRLFVYKYARFRIAPEIRPEQADKEEEHWDELKEMLKTDEGRKTARKSRFAFLALFLAVAAIAALFYVFAWGMAEQRVRNRAQLAEFARIAEKQGDVFVQADEYGVEVWSFDGGMSDKEIAQEDEANLERIFGELQWDYAYRLSWSEGSLYVQLHGGFESKYFYVYYGQQ